jgi:hypothetical protein
MKPKEQEPTAFDKYLEELELKLFEATQTKPSSSSTGGTSSQNN